MGREQRMLDTFVVLADSLAGDYDVTDFLQLLLERCGELLDVTTAGVLLEGPERHLHLAVALTADMEDLEQAEIDNEDGPCHEAYRTGKPVLVNDLDHSDVALRWPTVIDRLQTMGLKSVCALPIRLRDDRIGALNLYRDVPGSFADDDVRLGQAFADVAAIGILQERKVTHAEGRTQQLQLALDSRIVIEQAKGVISAERGIPIGQAFDLLRRHARDNNRRLHDVAQSVVDEGAGTIGGA